MMSLRQRTQYSPVHIRSPISLTLLLKLCIYLQIPSQWRSAALLSPSVSFWRPPQPFWNPGVPRKPAPQRRNVVPKLLLVPAFGCSVVVVRVNFGLASGGSVAATMGGGGHFGRVHSKVSFFDFVDVVIEFLEGEPIFFFNFEHSQKHIVNGIIVFLIFLPYLQKFSEERLQF